MGRLIRTLILVAALLVPAISGAQLVQNSATGELNTLTLDLSQATVTLNRVSVVDPTLSSVTVDPPIVTADGIAVSTITITLRDNQNQP
ncbi:MAG: Ig-like domain-containing protein, partial [Gammaproteobacteria bacterium]|nr:Ig-like domain-containing protein [Gammaproteobacteria bacterium]